MGLLAGACLNQTRHLNLVQKAKDAHDLKVRTQPRNVMISVEAANQGE